MSVMTQSRATRAQRTGQLSVVVPAGTTDVEIRTASASLRVASSEDEYQRLLRQLSLCGEHLGWFDYENKQTDRDLLEMVNNHAAATRNNVGRLPKTINDATRSLQLYISSKLDIVLPQVVASITASLDKATHSNLDSLRRDRTALLEGLKSLFPSYTPPETATEPVAPPAGYRAQPAAPTPAKVFSVITKKHQVYWNEKYADRFALKHEQTVALHKQMDEWHQKYFSERFDAFAPSAFLRFDDIGKLPMAFCTQLETWLKNNGYSGPPLTLLDYRQLSVEYSSFRGLLLGQAKLQLVGNQIWNAQLRRYSLDIYDFFLDYADYELVALRAVFDSLGKLGDTPDWGVITRRLVGEFEKLGLWFDCFRGHAKNVFMPGPSDLCVAAALGQEKGDKPSAGRKAMQRRQQEGQRYILPDIKRAHDWVLYWQGSWHEKFLYLRKRFRGELEAFAVFIDPRINVKFAQLLQTCKYDIVPARTVANLKERFREDVSQHLNGALRMRGALRVYNELLRWMLDPAESQREFPSVIRLIGERLRVTKLGAEVFGICHKWLEFELEQCKALFLRVKAAELEDPVKTFCQLVDEQPPFFNCVIPQYHMLVAKAEPETTSPQPTE